ncbi:B- and T-lymphocyte attenuator isoform X5 [Herpailurus yagouaroundi]|uniref:B- and T-lymphocyte attenuator isoform X5 n=1 Tax=Herpailurus yagouaroundi TaxID=1608482 RepID=UPI001AD724F2|nr:B- and T-lymphocyte attenuator isoform X5 [Puma yagouaroundi]
MKRSPGMLGIEKMSWVLFLIPHLGIWSINGQRSCNEQLYVKRYSTYTVSAGHPFNLECPVKYCTKRPIVTWCKLKGKNCLPLAYKLLGYTTWKEGENISVFSLHFNHALASDSGSYRCSANFTSGVIESHSVTINVTEQTQNNSEYPLITLTHISDTTGASGPPSQEVTADKRWMLYSLLPLGALPLLITCLCLFFCLRRHQAEKKEPSDTAGREINLVDIPQPFRSEETEVGTGQNPQTLLSETVPSSGPLREERNCTRQGPEITLERIIHMLMSRTDHKMAIRYQCVGKTN